MMGTVVFDPALLVLELGNSFGEYRLTATTLLAATGGPAQPALREAVAQGGPSVAGHALAALVLTGHPESLERLRRAARHLEGPREEPTAGVAEVPPAASSAVSVVLYRLPLVVRGRVLRLARLLAGRHRAGALRAAVLQGDGWCPAPDSEPGGRSPESVAQHVLLQLVTYQGSSPAMRCRAVETLAEVGDPAVVPGLCRAAGGQEREVHEALVSALVRIGAAGVEGLVEALQSDPIDASAVVAKQALVRLGPVAAPGLAAALGRSRQPHARRIAKVLASIRHPATLPHLVPLLSSGTLAVRREVVRAIGAIEHPAVVPALRVAVVGPHRCIRGPAAVELVRHGEVDAELISPLVEALEDPDERVIRLAAWALQVLAEQQPSLALRQALPPLRELASLWLASSDLRRACGDACAAIEASTGGVKDLPLPGSSQAVQSPELPIPAGPGGAEG